MASTLYYYVLNAQGDVIALLNSAGALAASYNYGAWGNYSVHDDKGAKNTSPTFIGHINPLRYRGYYYDRETRLYYLQSRYYDFANCRFINADGQLSVVDFSAVNLFAYCGNNPVNYIDPSGHAFMLITAAIGAVVGGVIGGITAAKNGGNIWAGVGTGMVIGGLVGMGAGAAIGIACAGSAAASTAAVATGFSALNAIVASSGVAAGAKMVGDNISRAFNAFPQVFWSGGDLAKNAACEFAKWIYSVFTIGEMQMGHFFVMSTRFNKCDASDFGLLPLAKDMALSPNDGSIWVKTELYNFGWGDENGYYRYPMPSFEKLFHLVLNSADEEDIYGAASVILKRYPDELLKQCEAIAENRGRSDDFGKLVKVFRLDSPVNRSPVLRKTYAQIQQDSRRWREIAYLAKGVKCKSCRLKSST